MMIPHPDLGPRPLDEFVYLGDATLCDRPAPDHPDRGATMRKYVYMRDNPAGLHRELWFHAQGDQSWLIVTRDTCTHEIASVEYARSKGGKG